MSFSNQKQSIPPLFKSIMENDEQRRITKASPIVNFSEAKRLHIEHKDLRRAAEKATAGTKDKGGSLA